MLHILILHQTTTHRDSVYFRDSVASYFDSTSNHNENVEIVPLSCVASYFDSTSNHNLVKRSCTLVLVASYFDSTSNHNMVRPKRYRKGLLHILILHQTTTFRMTMLAYKRCFIFWFYIKPQLQAHILLVCLVASYFDSTSNHNRRYRHRFWGVVASYFDSTSNHNSSSGVSSGASLLHILILHQTTTYTTFN